MFVFGEQPETNIVEYLVSDILQQLLNTLFLFSIFLRLADLLIVDVHEISDRPLVHHIDPLKILDNEVEDLSSYCHWLVLVHDVLQKQFVFADFFHSVVDGFLDGFDFVESLNQGVTILF